MLMLRRAGAPIRFTMSIRDYGSRLKAGTTSVKPQRIGYPAMRREQPPSRGLGRLQPEPRLGRQRLAGSRPDPRAEFLAVAVVGDAENLYVLNLGMAVEKLLDLARVEVF